LKLTIGNLVMSMIEENTAESLLVAKVTNDDDDDDVCRPNLQTSAATVVI